MVVRVLFGCFLGGEVFEFVQLVLLDLECFCLGGDIDMDFGGDREVFL